VSASYTIAYKIPGLSRTKPIFQDFPGPGNFTNRNPRLSRRHGNPDQKIRKHNVLVNKMEDSI